MLKRSFVERIAAKMFRGGRRGDRKMGRACQRARDRLARDYRQHAVVKLHIGCGPRILKGWLNIDRAYCHYAAYLKYYTDAFYPETVRGTVDDFYAIDVIAAPLPLPDNSVDVVFHEDFIEHLTQRDQIAFLSEMRRVMKPGAVHRVNTPNLLVSMREHSDFRKGFSGVCSGEWDRHGHQNVLSPRGLEEMAVMVGYSKVVFGTRDRSISEHIPPEYRPDPRDRAEDGNIFADLIK